MRRSLALLTLLAATAACSPQAQPPHQRALAAAARETLVRLIGQYDADIATLRRARDGPISATLKGQLTSDATIATAELRDAATRIARESQPRAQAAPAAPQADPGPATIARFQSAAEQRVARAIELRAQQLREREADAAFDFERAHAGRRLGLELKMRALHLAAPDAARYRRELESLTRAEELVVAAQRARDRAELDAYGAHLRAQASAGIASLTTELRARSVAARAVPTPKAGALTKALTRDDRAAAAEAFAGARGDIERRYAQLRQTHDAAQASLDVEIAALERQRDALRAALSIAQMRGAARPSPAPRSAGAASASSSPRD